MTKRDEAEGILLADVGGTNVRFAVLRDGKLGSVAYMAVTEHQQFADGVAAFMAAQADAHTIRHALFDAAGLVENGRCALTNNAWVVDAAELAARFGFAGIHIVNDFEAVAWSLPLMTADDLRMIGGRTPKPGAPMVVLGPGTGLGVAAYIPGNGGSVVRGEGGHVTMPSSDAREDAIIARLRQKLGHVSAERVVSGSGLENIYWAIAALGVRSCRNATRPRSRKPRSPAPAPSAAPRSILSARCWASSPAIAPSVSARRAASSSPAVLRRAFATICRNQSFGPASRRRGG